MSPRGKSAVTWAVMVAVDNVRPAGGKGAYWSERVAERIVSATDAARAAS